MSNKRARNNFSNREATQFKSGNQAVEMGRRGGIASGIANRKRKTLKEITVLLINQAPNEIIQKKFQKLFPNLDSKEMTVAVCMTCSMLNEAMNGNVKAYKEIRDTSGEKPSETVLMGDLDVVIDLDEEKEEESL